MFLEQTSPSADSMRKKHANSCPLYRNVPTGSPGPRDIPGHSGQEVSLIGEKIGPFHKSKCSWSTEWHGTWSRGTANTFFGV